VSLREANAEHLTGPLTRSWAASRCSAGPQVHNVAEPYAVFALIGVACAMVLYEPAFAIIVTRFDPP